jgi:hypothetical protein
MDHQRRALQFRRLISAELGEQAGDRFEAGARQGALAAVRRVPPGGR